MSLNSIIQFELARNAVIGCNRSKACVMMNPYNSLKSNIYKDLVGLGGSFVLVIDSQCEDHSKNE